MNKELSRFRRNMLSFSAMVFFFLACHLPGVGRI